MAIATSIKLRILLVLHCCRRCHPLSIHSFITPACISITDRVYFSFVQSSTLQYNAIMGNETDLLYLHRACTVVFLFVSFPFLLD